MIWTDSEVTFLVFGIWCLAFFTGWMFGAAHQRDRALTSTDSGEK